MRHWIHISGLLVLIPLAALGACSSDAADGADAGNADAGDEGGPPHLPSAKAVHITAGGQHACALVDNGTVRCWGYNAHGVLGTDANGATYVPVQVTGLTDITAISTLDDFTCALTKGGGVKCWGTDDNGQLGTGIERTDNSDPSSQVPVDVKGLASGVAMVDVGLDSACVVVTSGTVKCWGHDEYGKLGNKSDHSPGDSLPPHLPPVDVVGVTDAKQVSVGVRHACAVTNGGKLYCWGSNQFAELGLDDSFSHAAYVNVPTEVKVLGSNVSSVSAGLNSTCAIMKDGGVKCWGSNEYGTLGTGKNAIIGSEGPGYVVGLESGAGVTHISKPASAMCAVAKGAAKCWGKERLGLQQGPGYETYQPNGNVVGFDTNAKEVAIGGIPFSCALTTDGAVKCWGDSSGGVMGDGTERSGLTVDFPAPVLSLP